MNGEILYIPKTVEVNNELISKTRDEIKHVPCLFLRSTSGDLCPKIALFYHGNAEDVNLAYEIINHIRFTLGVFFQFN